MKINRVYNNTLTRWSFDNIKINSDLTRVTAIFVVVLFLTFQLPHVGAQTETTFTPANKFNIPEHNGTITFAVNGTYTKANSENGAWTFENLHLNNSTPLEKFQFSAENSNVTIFSYQQSSSAASISGIRLRYAVEGQGTQKINLGLDSTEGEWSVIFNGVFMGEGDGWHISPDSTFTIIDATGNVTLLRFTLPDYFGSAVDPNLPFYQKHSVAITIALIVAVTVVVAIAIRVKNKENQN